MALFRSLLLSLFLLFLVGASNEEQSYYDILGLRKDATLGDVKKAYRKLALVHHPDRNPGHEEEATLKFRQISEAYQVLSDESSRKEYDRSLRFGQGTTTTSQGGTGRQWQRRGGYRDPFAQFNDLFRNDPFFNEAFKDMDDIFARTFREGGAFNTHKKNEGWAEWLGRKALEKLNINVQISTSTNTGGGRRTATTKVWGSSSDASSSGGRSSTYTSRSTKTIYENGRRITIQSMEKDGNRIEEKYDGETLVERLINGVPQNVGLIEDLWISH